MSDTHVEATRETFAGRAKGSCAGAVLGVFVLVGAAFLLTWNERRSAVRGRALDEGERVVAVSSADRIDAGHEGRLVHVTGLATTTETLRDAELGVAETALRLRRRVEMYQWEETEERGATTQNADGSTTRTRTWRYSKAWKPQVVDSSAFRKPEGHRNPAAMPLPSASWMAEHATLGVRRLSRSLLEEMDSFEDVPLTTTSNLPAVLRDAARLHDGVVYLGKDPGSPEVGDARARVDVARPTVVSVVSRQVGGGFEPYRTTSGETLELLEEGSVDVQRMFQRARQRNALLTWGLRALGGLLMWMGFDLLLRPLTLLAGWVPWLGGVASVGASLISAVLAGTVATGVIAGAWLWNRPWAGLLIVAAVVSAAAWLLARQARARQRGLA